MDLVTLVLPELSPLLKTIVATLLGYERLSMISEVSMKDWLVETFTDEQMVSAYRSLLWLPHRLEPLIIKYLQIMHLLKQFY